MNQLLSVEGAAKEFGYHPRHIRRILKENDIRIVKFSMSAGKGKVFFNRQDFEKVRPKIKEEKQ